MPQEDGEIRAEVRSVCRPEGGTAYAATRALSGDFPGSITFTLKNWKGSGEPQNKQLVYLSGVYPTAEGLRAESARPVPVEEISPAE